MKYLRSPVRLAVLLSLISFSVFPKSPGRRAAETLPASQRVVLVELFTSEGCSTCPPAETLLEALESKQPIPGAFVVGMEEHVDYWNGPGWMDPYSSAEWTERQREYSEKIKGSSVYTPQLILEGRQQFVGSHEQEVETAIRDAAAGAKTELTVTSRGPDAGGSEEFQVRIEKLVGNSGNDTPEVWLALTEKGTQSSVRGGENAGRELRHAAVLRALRKIGVANGNSSSAVAFEGSAKLKIKPGWKTENLQAIAFVQEKKSWRILGAALGRTSSSPN